MKSVFNLSILAAGLLTTQRNAMGHNWVLSSESDAQAVYQDGMKAGLKNEYIKPDDEPAGATGPSVPHDSVDSSDRRGSVGCTV